MPDARTSAGKSGFQMHSVIDQNRYDAPSWNKGPSNFEQNKGLMFFVFFTVYKQSYLFYSIYKLIFMSRLENADKKQTRNLENDFLRFKSK